MQRAYRLRNYAVLLLLLHAYILLQPVIPYVDYMIRKGYIIENLCINKEEPEKQCNGKCHLEKQVKTGVEKTNENDVPFLPQDEKKELQEFLITELIGTAPIQAGVMSRSVYIGSYLYQYVPSIFHPPMQG